MNYRKFLSKKRTVDVPSGLESIPDLNSALFPFQRDIVAWALKRGRAAIFADCGLGKTLMQLEWARHVPGRVLILTPLAVAEQTVREGERFGIKATHLRNGDDGESQIVVTNYEMFHKFDPAVFHGIVLDESSILKSYEGATRTLLIESFCSTPFRLACTATPSPNDFMELGNHAEFLGTMSRVEMLSMFFVHDGGETQKWRLKGHAESDFWKWVCSWAVSLKKPSDLGYRDDGFELPPLKMIEHHITSTKTPEGMLFPIQASTLSERISARRSTVSERALRVAEIANSIDGPVIVWCNLNSEGDAIRKLIPGAVEIRGSDKTNDKEESLRLFSDGKISRLVTKPSIAGWGLNWQHCSNVIFVGLSDSYEQYYQAVRRCWRFGQESEVTVHIVSADTEGAVLDNIKRKEADAERMSSSMIEHMADISSSELHGATARSESLYKRQTSSGEKWHLELGDCVDVVRGMEDESIHYTIYSPPFASLYTYSNSARDMGNCKDHDEFFDHYRFLISELFRVTKPGRLVSFHCMNLPTSKVRDGVIGLRDFRGELIRQHESAGWIYHSEVCIWKDPVTAMQRTKALGLLHKQIRKDSCMSRMGIPDYVVTMRKPGENPEPVSHTADEFPVSVWQRYASPIWMDINANDTLQFRSAREHNDERHICPLQLTVIRRCLELWTNPGDLVLSPFAGIGSEGYEAVKMGRRFIGAELKEVYWQQACRNLEAAEKQQMPLFASVEEAEALDAD